jgi:ABC-type multidrug transport system fused ATPase/permease subunit
MEQGRILDIGPHEELLQRNAQYAKLYNTQFKVALAS